MSRVLHDAVIQALKEAHYEWQILNLSVPKNATIRVTYDIILNGENIGRFTQDFSGEATFVEAIQRCDIKQGLDFAISAEKIIEQIQKLLKEVTYSWSVEHNTLASELESQLNKIANPPAGEKNIEFEEGSAGSHTVDTNWPEGIHFIVQLGDAYYRLHFPGWSTWTNETTATPQPLEGSTLAITSNTNIHGVWTVEELPDVAGYGTLTKVIKGISEEELGSLMGRYFHIVNPQGYMIDVEFSQMTKTVAEDGTITLTHFYPITVEGQFTITEAGVDVNGYTRATTSSVTGGYADAEGDELLGGSTKVETVGGEKVVMDVKLPSATTYAAAGAAPNMGNVQFTNTYAKAWSENVKFVYPKLTLNKLDGDNDIVLQGAKFALTPLTDGATSAQSGITDQSGYIFFNELLPGEYELVETEAPEGYVKGYAKYKVVVTEPDTSNPNTPYTEVLENGVWYKRYECMLEVGYNIGNGWYPSFNLVKREGDYRLRAYNE